jgi:hypothetical protein
VTVLADGRIVEERSPQGAAAKVAAAVARLHTMHPTFAEGIAAFFHDPPGYGAMKVTVSNGVIVGVELTRTLSKG